MPWSFSISPKHFWGDWQHQRQLFEWLASELSLESQEQWYSISIHDLLPYGAGGLIQWRYQNSLTRALEAVYPEYEWHPWRFQHAPLHFWSDTHNHRWFFDWLGAHLEFEQRSDWYRL